jgi:ADP-ribosyl-[dinitrogen reductase] hydrolase
MEAHKLLFREITEKDFDPDCIPESGYVVDSLTVAVYSILHTDNYKDAVMMAVNFGYDTDTNAAITGSIAGAMYGSSGIPQGWLDALRKKEELIRIGEKFSACIGAC